MRYLRPVQLFNELLKLKTSDLLLGLSVGNRHVGLAVSDSTKRDAYLLRTLVKNDTNFDSVASDLQSVISKHSISGFVIGIPFSSPRGGPSELFLRDLIKTGKFKDMNFTFWDDKNTTKRRLQSQGRRAKTLPCKGFKDDYAGYRVPGKRFMNNFAAAEILQDYLHFVNDRAEEKIEEVY